MNNVKTAILLIFLTALLVGIGGLVAGPGGARIAFFVAIAMNVFAYWFGDKLVLKMYRAHPVSEAQAPELHAAVADLAQRAQIPMPALYVIPGEAPNAFATGRNPSHAAVAVTEGLLRLLDRGEVQGVLAHELCHIRHRDILIGTVAAVIAGAINLLYYVSWLTGGDEDSPNPLLGLVMILVAGFAASMIQLAISRSREFEADAGAARLLGTGEPLARALGKLDRAAAQIPMHANPATAHLFIVSPLSGNRGSRGSRRGGGFARLFRTHPTTEERVARLRDRSWAA